MSKPKVDLSDVIKTMFLIKLSAKLKTRKPGITKIKSILIESIAKQKGGKSLDYKATIEGLDKEKAEFRIIYEHQEECVWVPVPPIPPSNR
jgi:hypothetical protein